MSYSVKTNAVFQRQSKRLIKKFPSLKSEIQSLILTLKEDPKTGIPIGNDCYKIRVSVASKNKGKSGGARVITHFYILQDTVYLLSIYDKSEIENITDKVIAQLVNEISE